MRRARHRQRRQGRPAREDRGADGGDRTGGAVGRSLHRHCEELLRRSNPDCHCGNSLDCFAALAMTGVEARSRHPHRRRPCERRDP
ncbi:hypothetical protein WN72_00750 [Bradyrhizobium arachidis]|uniref:Uncharacterized protein n=1 Tax=Bradyrhizobium arachidis TaxID=858423 RepID=A0AAE7TEF7_9BRAD|nr:hypothetical protein WN72_00750 [Bradyrhizobium arachidis]